MTFGNSSAPSDSKNGTQTPGLNGGLSGVYDNGAAAATTPVTTPATTTAAASTSEPSNASKPAYTPTHADASVITAGLAGFNPAENLPQFSPKFTSLVGSSSVKKRTLIGGSW